MLSPNIPLSPYMLVQDNVRALSDTPNLIPCKDVTTVSWENKGRKPNAGPPRTLTSPDTGGGGRMQDDGS